MLGKSWGEKIEIGENGIPVKSEFESKFIQEEDRKKLLFFAPQVTMSDIAEIEGPSGKYTKKRGEETFADLPTKYLDEFHKNENARQIAIINEMYVKAQ